jgi:inosine/xanthosine triphosphatase
MQKVVITSTNPVKIEATKTAFTKMFADKLFEFEFISSSSGVSDQPFSDAETRTGAKNRVLNAESILNADFYVGIEAGLMDLEHSMESFTWIYIKSGDKIGRARTATFFLPQKVTELIKSGLELGEADDIVFGSSNSKQANGAVGLLSGDVITRSSYYTEALCMALIPFKNPELY